MLYALQVVCARTLRSRMTATLAQIYLLNLWAWIISYLCEIQEQSGNSKLDYHWLECISGLPVCKVESFPLTQTCNKFLKDCRLCNLFLSVWHASLERSKPRKVLHALLLHTSAHSMPLATDSTAPLQSRADSTQGFPILTSSDLSWLS